MVVALLIKSTGSFICTPHLHSMMRPPPLPATGREAA
jgi:hypothetical protein